MLTVSGSRSTTIGQDAQHRTSPVTAKATLLEPKSRLVGEVVPDSEDDRRKNLSSNEVIEISSDEEDNTSGKSHTLGDRFLPTSGSWPTNQKSSDAKEAHENLRHLPIIATPRKLYRAPRRVVESSDSEDSGAEERITRISEVIELSDSSPEGPVLRETELFRKITTNAPTLSENEMFESDKEDDFENDDSILVLYEPRSARKPLQLPNFLQASPVSHKQLPDLTYDCEQSTTLDRDVNNLKGTAYRPKVPKARLTQAKPVSTANTPGSRSKGITRLTKKAKAAAEQERRVTYAQSLFEELNRSVFEDKLPKETKLNWSKRLLTTAGRAKWHRYKSRNGVQTTEIELAEKILDCDERIRNTLSHEMCHLASWIIDARPKEVHGSIFKAWSNKVMRARPEIVITTKHNYEIDFKFNWKCLQCSKIYGRHSKSIDVAKVVCGACRKGRLIALFETRASRNSKMPKTSDLAAVKLQDSPRPLPQIFPDVLIPSEPNASADRIICVSHGSDSEQDAEIDTLTTAMDSVTFIGQSLRDKNTQRTT